MGTRRQFSREFKVEAVKLGNRARRCSGASCARPRCARDVAEGMDARADGRLNRTGFRGGSTPERIES